jgi:hypothetical protein
MTFLPEGYTVPKTNKGYMKLQDGENKIRILTKPIIGWEDWNDKKPVRFRMNEKPSAPIDPKKQIKHFWSFVVWNYHEKDIQILHVTQATVKHKIQTLVDDGDWGAPYNYDIKIIKRGEGIDTEYDVNPLPHRELTSEIIEAFYMKPINLNALFDNADPFDRNMDSKMCVKLEYKGANSMPDLDINSPPF